MRNLTMTALLLAGGLLLVAADGQPARTAEEKSAAIVLAQAEGDTAAAGTEAGTAPKSDEEEESNRLPPYYGKLAVTDKQRMALYAVQAKYRDQIEELEKQIAALKAKRATEMQLLLTPGQKLRLKELLTEAARRRTETDKASGPENTSE